MVALFKERLPQKLINLFKEIGRVADILDYNAYLVGGMVRDVFLDRENLDVDIVIEGDGIKFAHEFEKFHNVRVRSHRKFGTAVIIFPDGFKVDVATARIEYYESPAAPPIVETSSLKMDLYRRDFTINTLAVKLNRRHFATLVDYFGGMKDIKEKVIRVLHNLSFVEDPTRVLRAIRFEQRFGFKIGKLTLSLIRNAVSIDCFRELSGRRLFLELKLLLMEQEPIHAIERMNEFELLQYLSPQIRWTNELIGLIEEVRDVISWFNLLYLEDEPLEEWKVYWHGLTDPLDERSLLRLAKRLQMEDLDSRRMLNQRKEVNKGLDQLFRFQGDDNYALYTLLSQYDTEILLYMMAKSRNEKTKRLISIYFTKLKGTEIQLKGSDLKLMGFKPGPVYREILDSLIRAKLNNLVSSREDEVRFVRETFGGLQNDIKARAEERNREYGTKD
jgi:tRNA nucleotidyltransferase (CCA-adding enzyme)